MRLNVPAQAVRQKEKSELILPPPLFYSGLQWNGQCPPTLGRATLLSQPVQMLVSTRNTLLGTPRNNV